MEKKSLKTTENDTSRLTSLIMNAAAGSDDAFTSLVNMFSPMINASVSGYPEISDGSDRDELRQEALLAFHRAVKSFDPFYGNVSFGLFAKICVTNAVSTAAGRMLNRKELPVISIEDLQIDTFDGNPSDETIAKENVENLRRKIIENLSPFENTVWWSHYSGMSARDIADATGKSEKSVNNALCRVRSKLRTLLS